MAMTCTKVTEWIETEISKPIEDWESRTKKECKKRHWYDPRRWLCWLVTFLVMVIRWVIVTVVTAIITFVCHLVADLLSALRDFFKFLGNLFIALITWDKCALQDALGNLVDTLIVGVFELIGDVVIRPITDRIQTYRLRGYVGDEIDKRYAAQPEVAQAIKDALNVDTGVFGYHVNCTVYHMYVDSETKTKESGDLPNLFFLHDKGAINLYELAGFDDNCAITIKAGWRHSVPQTARKSFAGGGGDLIGTDPPELTRDQLTEYIDSRGASGPPFFILAMSNKLLGSRTEAAETKGRQLGLIFQFSVKMKEVTDPDYIKMRYFAISPLPLDCATKVREQVDFFICELGRHPKNDFLCCDSAGNATHVVGTDLDAHRNLCFPVAVAVFRYDDFERSGNTDNLIGTTGFPHDLHASITSGVTFRSQIPNEGRKFVLIHELGHYFGLTHVDGLDRVMTTAEEGQGDLLTWGAIPNFLWHGGPRFIYTEAQRVWNFILTNFPTACLLSKGKG